MKRLIRTRKGARDSVDKKTPPTRLTQPATSEGNQQHSSPAQRAFLQTTIRRVNSGGVAKERGVAKSSALKRSVVSASSMRRGTDSAAGKTPASQPKRLLATPRHQSGLVQQTSADGAGLSTTAKAPVSSVAQATELGEQARVKDEIIWALQGLSTATERNNSLATLVELYSNRRTRVGLSSSTVGADVLTHIGKLKLSVQEDPVTALGVATILLLLALPGGDPMLFVKREVATAIAAVLRCVSSVPADATAPIAATRMLRVLHDAPINRLLPKEAAYSPVSVALTSLACALDPRHCGAEVDRVKLVLRQGGALLSIAHVAVSHGSAIGDPVPTMSTVQSLWQLHQALSVLEHSSFACEENETALVAMNVSAGVAPFVARQSLPAWLIQQLQSLAQQGSISGLKKDCLRSVLAVLMNITQGNGAGCIAVAEAGGVQAVCLALAKIVLGGEPRWRGALYDPQQLEAWVEELTVCLGLLINLAEQSVERRIAMRAVSLQVDGRPGDGDGSSGHGEKGVVWLLSRIITAVAGGVGEPRVTASSQHEDEVTLDTLQRGEGEAAGSIIEVYAAILLGFLVDGDIKAQEEVAQQLPGGTLAPVISAVQRCLHFYVATGALTQSTEASLRALVASLQDNLSKP